MAELHKRYPTPFKLNLGWLEEDFVKLVKDLWYQFDVILRVYMSLEFEDNLKKIKQEAPHWAHEKKVMYER